MYLRNKSITNIAPIGSLQLNCGFSFFFIIVKTWFFVCVLFTCNSTVVAQIYEQNIGNVPIQNYSPKEYKGEPQVNRVAIDSRGVLYFAHNSGLSIFDGTEWENISINDNSVQSIYISENDKIYVGSEGEFGELLTNEKGVLYYASLTQDLDSLSDLSDIFSITEKEGSILFSDYNNIYILDRSNKTKVVSTEDIIQETYLVHGQVYVNLQKLGLFLFDDNFKLTPILGNEALIGKKINQVIDHGKDSIFIIDSEKMYLSPKDKIELTSINLQTDGKYTYSSAYKLSDDNYVVSLASSGLIIISKGGKILEHIGIENGLITNSVKSFCETNDGNIAVATDNGISLIHYTSKIRTFNTAENIHGAMEAVFGKGDSIYVVGKEGVFSFHRAEQTSFKEIDNLGQQGFGGGMINNTPFIVLYDGVFKLENDTLLMENGDIAWSVYQYNHEFYLVGGDGEFIVYKKSDNGEWSEYARHPTNSGIKSMYTDKNGSIWLGTYRGEGGLYKLDPDFNSNKNFNSGNLTYFGINQLGVDGDVYVFGDKKKVYFGTKQGIKEFDYQSKKIIASSLEKNSKNYEIPLAKYDQSGNLWQIKVESVTKRTLGFLDISNVWHSEDFNKVNENMIYGIYPEDKKNVWLAGPNGLFLYTFNSSSKESTFNTYFKEIRIGDSLVHAGNFKTESGFSFDPLENDLFIFPYSKTALTFQFGATNYIDASQTKFSYYLEGFDEGWSNWTSDYSVKYTNLPEGHYILKAKSISSSGIEGVPTEINFEVLAPWYRTWWFYSIVVIAGILILYALFMHRTATLRKRQVVLEQTIKERTSEVIEQKKEAETQRDLAQKEHQIAEEQKHLVEEKNQEISDSINYAERIQRAMLANEKMVQQHLNNYFIFFQPKDVVSGDFYWASLLSSGKLVLVNADSTGHGVPGAIMSMLNMNSLKEAVSGKGLTAPHEILNHTRKIIKETLQNDGSADGGKDGMDCSLMVFDLDNNQIQFSAANNPVWIIREGDIIEFKGDKMPVGKHDRDSETFTTQSVEVQKGDVIYTLTDGMPDQFGGPKGKKFMYKRLKNLLIEIAPLEMDTQHDRLKFEMKEWMADEEQVDDVCIIGVRV
jgi:serine phosphatase RsbU (regulator of sigma subunit)